MLREYTSLHSRDEPRETAISWQDNSFEPCGTLLQESNDMRGTGGGFLVFCVHDKTVGLSLRM